MSPGQPANRPSNGAFSGGRSEPFSTSTRIKRGPGNRLGVHKTLRSGEVEASKGPLSLANCVSPWANGLSLQTLLAGRCAAESPDLSALFQPAKSWLEAISADAVERDGRAMLTGAHIDSIWGNFYPEADPPVLIDREWVWEEEIPQNSLVIRAIYTFLARLEDASPQAALLQRASGGRLIRDVAKALGIDLQQQDFDDFLDLEVRFQENAYNLDPTRYRSYLRWYLAHRPSLKAARTARNLARRVRASLEARLGLMRHAAS